MHTTMKTRDGLAECPARERASSSFMCVFSLAVVALLMSGCLSNAHRERYEGLLADLRSQPASAVRLADDSRAVETQPGVHLQDFEKELTLESAVATARRRNPEMIAMLRRWEVLIERIPQVGSLDDPQLTYLYNVAPIETRAGPMQNEFALSQRIPFPGKLSLREEVAIADHLPDLIKAP